MAPHSLEYDNDDDDDNDDDGDDGDDASGFEVVASATAASNLALIRMDWLLLLLH